MTQHRDPDSVSSVSSVSAASARSEDWTDLLKDLPAEARLLAEGMLQREDADLRAWLTGSEVSEPTRVRLVDAEPQASDQG